MIDKRYPTVPSREYYLVYKIEGVHDAEFENRIWDITKLKDFKTSRGSGLPFATTLIELMNLIVKAE